MAHNQSGAAQDLLMEIESKDILVLLAPGTEEMEAVITIDTLVRAGFNVTTASTAFDGNLNILCSRGVTLVADTTLAKVADDEFECIVLPGGVEGAKCFRDSPLVIEIIKQQICDQRWVAAICAAPALVLAHHNIYPQAFMTCHPDFAHKIPEYYLKTKRVMVDTIHHLITSQGPGSAQEFALEIVSQLSSKQHATDTAAPMVLLPSIVFSAQSIENQKKIWKQNSKVNN